MYIDCLNHTWFIYSVYIFDGFLPRPRPHTDSARPGARHRPGAAERPPRQSDGPWAVGTSPWVESWGEYQSFHYN